MVCQRHPDVANCPFQAINTHVLSLTTLRCHRAPTLDPHQMAVKSDIEIAREASMNPITEVGAKLDIPADQLVSNGFAREDGFDITVASEIMAIFCLAKDLDDLTDRIGKIVVGYTRERKAVCARDIKAHSAMAVLLKDALMPNLVQTLENNPAFIHGGPFANIAHGCNSVSATKTALKLADYVVTEAGFGADLGAEKFFDIKCRKAGLAPSAVVLVATVRALKMHGGVAKADLGDENVAAVEAGCSNLARHLENVKPAASRPSTPTTCRCSTRSRPCAPRSTVQKTSQPTPRCTNSSPTGKQTATAICRSAWPRRSIPSRPTPTSKGRQKDTASTSVKCACLPARVSLSPLPATS